MLRLASTLEVNRNLYFTVLVRHITMVLAFHSCMRYAAILSFPLDRVFRAARAHTHKPFKFARRSFFFPFPFAPLGPPSRSLAMATPGLRVRLFGAILLVLSVFTWILLSLRADGELGAWHRVSWLSSPNTPSPTSYLTAARTPEPLVFVMIMLGASTAQEGGHLLKSILMHSSTAVHLHIICTSDAVPVLWRRFALVTRPAYELEVTLYQVERDQVVQRA
jgi:hypothetical protein